MISIKGILGLGTAATLSLAILATASTPAFADQTSKSLDVNLTLGNSISVRILDSTATSDLSLLSFDLTPTAAGVTSTKRAIVDVSTSNITGYKLYVEANGKDHQNNYTTDLVQGDTADSHVIPTSTSTSSNKNFWNYVNPATSSATVVPAHGNPDQIGYLLEPTTSTKANVDINVGVDTTITAGSYTNQLLFTAIANPDSIGYTLNFNSNLPSGADPSTLQNFPANQAVSSSAASYTFTIPSTTPTLTGYDLVHYQNANDSTETYSPGDTVTVNADPSSSTMSGSKTLNAIWSNITYDIAFDANEPSGTTATGSTASMTNLDYNTSYSLTTNGYAIAGHSFQGWCTVAVTNPVADSSACATASGTYYADGASVQGLSDVTGTEITLYAMWTINSYTLTVNPNGGTWEGSTSSQSFTQNYGTTKSISNPTAGPTYAISYDMNDTGITPPSSPTSVDRPFSSWSLSGAGTMVGNTYTYEAGNGALTADYSTTSNSFTLPALSKTGFACKWAEGSTSGTQYNGGTSRTITADTIYYAVCKAQDIRGISYLQEITPVLCLNTPIGTTATLTDSRDENDYTVARLADGQCWMTQNLRLVGPKTLTSSDSNVTTSYSLPAVSSSSWCTDTNQSCVDRANTYDTGNTNYGVYYTWYAATAGTGNYSTTTGNASSSICPKGWRLPTGGSSGEYLNLFGVYGSVSAIMSTPANFVLSGRRTGSDIGMQGEWGRYWSSTANNNSKAYVLSLTTTDGGSGSNGKTAGYTVRCVASNNSSVPYVTIVNNATTSDNGAINLPAVGNSEEISVTPMSGFYLSSVNCSSGLTCTGYNTGTSATETQTVTVTNTSATSNGTITFAADSSTASLKERCVAYMNKTIFAYNNKNYIKLIGNAGGSNSACYTKDTQGTTTWANAVSLCSSASASLPTREEITALTSVYGYGGGLYNTTGWSGTYWTSTEMGNDYAYTFIVNSSRAEIAYDEQKTRSFSVTCVVR